MKTPPTETAAWGEALRRQREAANLTQEGLARRLSEAGVVTAMTSVSRWELGKVMPPAHRRAMIDKILAEAAGVAAPTPVVPEENSVIARVRMLYEITEGQGHLWESLEERVSEIYKDLRTPRKRQPTLK